MTTHGKVIGFGKHKGERFTRLPVSYLLWMTNTETQQSEIAKAELERRGTTIPEVDVSGHAIDKAHLRCGRFWKETRKSGDEGIYSWLCRVAADALKEGASKRRGTRYYHLGMTFVFELGHAYPVLKTVFPTKED